MNLSLNIKVIMIKFCARQHDLKKLWIFQRSIDLLINSQLIKKSCYFFLYEKGNTASGEIVTDIGNYDQYSKK